MAHRNSVVLSFAAVAGALAVLAAGLDACSLGDGVTPACDAAASPGTPNACADLTECDDGNGYVKPTDGCCVRVGNLEYGSCLGETVTTDFRTPCAGNADGCCDKAQSAFDSCMAGPQTTAGGNGGAGGAPSGGGGAGGGAAGSGG